MPVGTVCHDLSDSVLSGCEKGYAECVATPASVKMTCLNALENAMQELPGASGGHGGTKQTKTVPLNTAKPAVKGTAAKGSTLTATTGAWSNHTTSYTYKWTCDGITSCSSLPSSPTLTDPGNVSVSVSVSVEAAGSSLPARSNTVTAAR